MAIWLNATDEDFESAFQALLSMKREVSKDVGDAVDQILARVKAEGDAALADYSARFDSIDFARTPMRVGAEEIDAAHAAVDPNVIEALTLAERRIRSHHAGNCRKTISTRTRSASALAIAGRRWKPSGFMCRAAPPATRVRC